MSESVPSQTDPAVPVPQGADIGQVTGSIATSTGAEVASAATIERLTERLRFYESFDSLIQQNIAQAGQLMREAGERRDEAVATIAESQQQVATVRETQRAALTDLLDDVMTIQQATERLAHRVSNALEQIEYELEPIGLHETGALGGESLGRLPARSSPAGASRSVAEDVDDEYRLGVLGQPRPGEVTTTTGPVTGEAASIEAPSIAQGGSQPAIGSETTTGPSADAGPSAPSTDRGEDNPENSGLTADPARERDAGETGGHGRREDEWHEARPGEGSEAAPIEASAKSWTNQAAISNPATDDNDLMSVVEPYAEANIIPYAEEAGPIGDAALLPEQLATDASDAASGIGALDDAPASGRHDDGSIEVGSAFGQSTEPASGNLTSPDDAPIQTAPEIPVESDNVAGQASVDTGMDAETVVVAADVSVPSAGTASTTDPFTPPDSVAAPASESILAVSAARVASEGGGTGAGTADRGPVAVGSVGELQTTVVLEGVPRAAIALAIQRHLLSRPDVRRAEVREYYDHRLTLFVSGRRATTADDLEGWDGSATWEQIRTSPGVLELRMVM